MLFNESNQEKGEASEDNHLEFTERGTTICINDPP